MKIKLRKEKNIDHLLPPHYKTEAIEYLRPFFKSRHLGAKLFHRVRSASRHLVNGDVERVSIAFWCGGGGFLNRGQTYSRLPLGAVRCAVCEGKAIGAGMDGEKIINGNAVNYSPR